MTKITVLLQSLLIFFSLIQPIYSDCQPCYSVQLNENCQNDNQILQQNEPPSPTIHPVIIHTSINPQFHPNWLYNLNENDQQNEQLKANNKQENNNKNASAIIFDNALRVLAKSQQYLSQTLINSQKGHRKFFIGEVLLFSQWFIRLHQSKQNIVRKLVQSGRWEILGGGLLQNDQACFYYEDIILNQQLGLNFLKEKLDYVPKIAISYSSLGHSQSAAAIFSQSGIQGLIVQKFDQHLLSSQPTYIWSLKSSNNQTYGILPTHLSSRPGTPEPQFTYINEQTTPLCEQKSSQFDILRKQNSYIKNVTNNSFTSRYFGHDFQMFQEYQFQVVEAFMEQVSRERCEGVIVVYANPVDFFIAGFGQGWGNANNVSVRYDDLFPVWNYDNAAYYTGYYTTSPTIKKYYRNMHRILHIIHKALALSLTHPPSTQTSHSLTLLQSFSQLLFSQQTQALKKVYKKLSTSVLQPLFQNNYPLYTNNPIHQISCGILQKCQIPDQVEGNLLLKVFNSGSRLTVEPIVVRLKGNYFYQASCQHEIVCLCAVEPCQCDIYLYLQAFTFTQILLARTSTPKKLFNLKQAPSSNSFMSYNSSHFILKSDLNPIYLSYKSVMAQTIKREYQHINRYGQKTNRSGNISGDDYILANNPLKAHQVSSIYKVYVVETKRMKKILIQWSDLKMRTIIQSCLVIKNSWKITTFIIQPIVLSDVYFQIGADVKNNGEMYTDSNGWLIMKRKMFQREGYKAFFSDNRLDDISGNTYPVNAFAYIQDQKLRLAVHTDRPQGVTSIKQGKIWINIDRLTKENKAEQKQKQRQLIHYITIEKNIKNSHSSQIRLIQQLYDQPILLQLNQIEPSQRFQLIARSSEQREKWANLTNIESTKFWIRPRKDSSIILRIQNIFDDRTINVGLFNGKVLTFLTTYYGNAIGFDTIQQMALAGNINYQQFINSKWNLNKIVNLTQPNEIYDRKFGEVIELKPLQIRTFLIKGIKSQTCQNFQSLKKSDNSKLFRFDNSKNFPSRQVQAQELEKKLKEFLLNVDHCEGRSPVSYSNKLGSIKMNYEDLERVLAEPNKSDKKVEIDYMPDLQAYKTPDPHQTTPTKYQPTSQATPPPKQPQQTLKQKIQRWILKEPTQVQQKQIRTNRDKVQKNKKTIEYNKQELALIMDKIVKKEKISQDGKNKYFAFKLDMIKNKVKP